MFIHYSRDLHVYTFLPVLQREAVHHMSLRVTTVNASLTTGDVMGFWTAVTLVMKQIVVCNCTSRLILTHLVA